ncbi:DUF805 domain-containing protein [Deinococcus oregonensis]|uniref:DUF805 domain-containing protein n=1 Tax=Deinococcus oregonensis TaxID=1805970 RepID=A0ABV6AVR8_9DEIO
MNDFLKVFRNNYANFSGRARRREYWMFSLISGIISLVLQLPFQIQNVTQAVSGGEVNPNGLGLLSIFLAGIYGLAVFIPSLAVGIRRLHDTGRSGWWLLITLVPFVGSIVLLIFNVTDSQPGNNQWGANPKGTAPVQSGAWG